MTTSIPLSKASQVIMGQSPPGDTYNEDGVGLPLLNGPTEFGPTHPECSLFTTDTRRECEPGDLIFCVRGSTTGRMNWADRKYSLGRGVCAFRARSQAETRFVRYCIQDKLHALLQLAGGGTFPNLTKDTIESFEIPWPDDRVRIAGILSAYDDLIENSQRRIKILESMARAIYREWFVHFRFPGHENHPLVPSPLGEIPEGWEVRPLREVCRLTMGQSPKSEFYNETGEGFAFHQGVTDFGDRFPSDRLFCTADGRIAEVGDILFSVRAPVGRLNIANKRIMLGRGLSAVRHNQDCQVFLWEQLKNRFTEDDMMGNGAIFASVTKDDMQRIDLFCPPYELIESATRHLEPLHLEVAALSQQVDILRRTRDLLLPRLLSGQIALDDLEPV